MVEQLLEREFRYIVNSRMGKAHNNEVKSL